MTLQKIKPFPASSMLQRRMALQCFFVLPHSLRSQECCWRLCIVPVSTPQQLEFSGWYQNARKIPLSVWRMELSDCCCLLLYFAILVAWFVYSGRSVSQFGVCYSGCLVCLFWSLGDGGAIGGEGELLSGGTPSVEDPVRRGLICTTAVPSGLQDYKAIWPIVCQNRLARSPSVVGIWQSACYERYELTVNGHVISMCTRVNPCMVASLTTFDLTFDFVLQWIAFDFAYQELRLCFCCFVV